MDKRKQNGNQGASAGQPPNVPTDQGEDADERQRSAQQAWDDKQGLPRGAREQGKQAPDRVGGSGRTKPAPELEPEIDPENAEEGEPARH